MKNRTQLYIDLINRIAEQSECISRKVGAIIVKNDSVFGEGWNSPPSKCKPEECLRCNSPDHQSGKDLNMALCAHAEANLIATCAKEGRDTNGAEMWCTTKPCAECAKLIVRAGIKKVQYLNDYPSPYTDLIFKNAGIWFGNVWDHYRTDI